MNTSAKKSPECPVRVLFVLPDLQGGGAERTAINLLEYVDQQRFDCRIACLRQTGVHFATARKNGWLIDVPDAPAFFKKMALENPMRALYSSHQIGHACRVFRPDVIVTFMLESSFPVWLARLHKRYGVQWIAREGNNAFRVIDAYFEQGWAGSAIRWALKTVLTHADKALFVSEQLARDMTNVWPIESSRSCFVHNPVKPALCNANDVNLTHDDRPMILGIGRLAYQKGFDLLIEAFAQSLASKGYELVILGEGPERKFLEAKVRALGIQDCVRMPGFVSEPREWLAQADAFVLSSRWEGFGHVLVEAMACAVPVIASHCDYGPEEILQNGECGLLVTPENVVALAEALNSLSTQPHIWAQRVDAALSRAKDFEPKLIAEQYEALFVSVLVPPK